MASSGSFSSVGGYRDEFLTAEQQVSTRADSDLMFGAIKNQEMNTAELMIERMKFASAQTSVAEGEAIIGEAQEVQEAAAAVPAIPEAEAVQVGAEPEVAVSSTKIEDIPPENIESVRHSSEDPLPSSRVGSVLRDVLESIHNSLRDPVASEVHIAEAVASGHTEEVVMEEAPIQGEQEMFVENHHVEDAPT
ncbi:hypothetical protein Taro_008893 [Colocasia esculenta]|uniref:Uncharacterized protein n=1 Tax=Colocasia esculenta TaxID=4460 RepID=A0A843TYV9_COLES|nr:hypothetical protein [Colocasia esculenta]